MTAETPGYQDIPTTTGFELPGRIVRDNLGVCFGLVARSVGIAKTFTGGLRALRKGEVSQYTEVLEDARRQAVDRMIENARLLGADAIIGVRFDSSEVGQQLTEVVAYGTAVTTGSGE